MRYGNYSFGPGFGLTPAVKGIMLANGVVFVLQMIAGYSMVVYFGLVPQLIIHKGFIWQLVTYMFLHGGFFHILFNMFAVWMFGTEIERYWGTREFIGHRGADDPRRAGGQGAGPGDDPGLRRAA